MQRRLPCGRGLRCSAPAPVSLLACRAHTTTPGKVRVHVTKRVGKHSSVDAPAGVSLMHALRDIAKLDVEGTCEGGMVCGTCHVKLSPASFRRTDALSEREEDVLAKALDVQDTSRLACQVRLTPELDGLEVELPSYGANSV
ncbi:hypothetical protein LSCM1_01563 [Leishmania martiniquensis]|uniref:2Fe-2S ferredoxin-type domain-containing protein n=1 Tax=Leishmania martiniquensis TaxID=1580590 RepID=A0A836KMR3_9TRYP|nr:hypothetical protein LSCM1_01563 [Leishmania martiniquensis]